MNFRTPFWDNVMGWSGLIIIITAFSFILFHESWYIYSVYGFAGIVLSLYAVRVIQGELNRKEVIDK